MVQEEPTFKLYFDNDKLKFSTRRYPDKLIENYTTKAISTLWQDTLTENSMTPTTSLNNQQPFGP